MYQPKEPFTTPFNLLIPVPHKVLGQVQKAFTPSESSPLFCSWKSFGGKEVVIDNILAVENTAVIETWWTPEFKNNCQIELLDDNSVWEILNIENISRRNQYARIKIRYMGGGS